MQSLLKFSFDANTCSTFFGAFLEDSFFYIFHVQQTFLVKLHGWLLGQERQLLVVEPHSVFCNCPAVCLLTILHLLQYKMCINMNFFIYKYNLKSYDVLLMCQTATCSFSLCGIMYKCWIQLYLDLCMCTCTPFNWVINTHLIKVE